MELIKVRSILQGQRADSLKDLNVHGGDVIWIQYRDHINSVRFKTFQGVCISIKQSNKGGYGGQLCTLRTLVGGVGVDFCFHSLSKNIRQIKKVMKSNRSGRVKLYTLNNN